MKLSKKPNETNLEEKVRQELEKRGIEFLPQFPFKTGFIADFYIPSRSIIIEADGEIWHTNKKKEIFRDYMFKRCGITVIHLKGNDILSDVSKCVGEALTV